MMKPKNKRTKISKSAYVCPDTSESEEKTSGSEYSPSDGNLSSSDSESVFNDYIDAKNPKRSQKINKQCESIDLSESDSGTCSINDFSASKNKKKIVTSFVNTNKKQLQPDLFEACSNSSLFTSESSTQSTATEPVKTVMKNTENNKSVDLENFKKRKQPDFVASNTVECEPQNKKTKNLTKKIDLITSKKGTNKKLASSEKSDSKNAKKKDDNSTSNSIIDANSSLDVSINLKSVGPVIKNKKFEVLKSSKSGVKKYTCYYCLKDRQKTGDPNKKIYFAKLVDHLESAHANEEHVKELKKIPKVKMQKGKKQTLEQINREKILAKLRNEANYLNNLQVDDVADYIVARRPTANSGNTVANYGSCLKCHKQLSLSSLHKHTSKCTGLSFKHKHVVKSSSRATVGDYHEVASEEAIKIISKMRENNILDEIKYDYAIISWLNCEASKYETTPHNHNKVRANLRRLGRLKLEMRILNDKIEEFSDIFNEEFYDQFIEACKILGKADQDTKYMAASSTANDMSFLIKSVGSVYHVNLGPKKPEERTLVDGFLNKVKVLWHSSIGNTIAETQAKNRRNIIVTLPSEEDMLILRKYLENQMFTSYNELRITYTDNSYTKLRNAIVSYLHVCNCRRAGEIQKLSIEDFNQVQIVGDDCRIQVRGKRTKPVPIVFEKQIHTYLLLLIKNRRKANICAKNPYVFSDIHDATKEYTFVSACDLMKEFSESCGAKNPTTLRGTLFRKQVATKGMENGISDQEVEKLSGYLGHTPKIHMQNYRQSIFDRDIAVSNLVREAQTKCKTPKKVMHNSEQNNSKNQSSLHDNNAESIKKERNYEDVIMDNVAEEENNFDCETEANNMNNENDGDALNCSDPSGLKKKKLPWTTTSINALLAHFPNALDTRTKVPSRAELLNFISKTDDKILKLRKEPDIRQWIHWERKKNKTTEQQMPARNHIPTYVYGQFEKYIAIGKIPSNKTCSKFLAESPSRSHLSIAVVQNWVKSAIKRKST